MEHMMWTKVSNVFLIYPVFVLPTFILLKCHHVVLWGVKTAKKSKLVQFYFTPSGLSTKDQATHRLFLASGNLKIIRNSCVLHVLYMAMKYNYRSIDLYALGVFLRFRRLASPPDSCKHQAVEGRPEGNVISFSTYGSRSLTPLLRVYFSKKKFFCGPSGLSIQVTDTQKYLILRHG